jgi:hypothetical protein
MTTREFVVAELMDQDFPWEAPEGWEIVSDKISGKSRWSDVHTLIFRTPDLPSGQAWQTTYRRGATEQQEERPWQYQDKFTATLVHEVEKTMKVWEAIPG